MRKGVFFGVVIALIVFSILGFGLTQTGFATSQTVIDEDYLENLRLKAQVECLQNSQCFGGYECVGNECIDSEEIDICQDIKLFTPTRKLELGQPINSIKSVLTDGQLPYLLPDGEIVEIINDEIIEHFYIQAIFIGENNIERENGKYIIKINNEPIYIYKLIFSTGVDFSRKQIQGQIIRILGEEYVIGSNSDNSVIKLISDKRTVKLQDTGNIKITRDEKGNIIIIEIAFFPQNNIKVNEDFSDSIFDSVQLSFNYADNGFADVRVGGNC